MKAGRLVETARDRYTLAEHAAKRQNLIAGRLTMHRDGYGFVIPNADQRSTVAADVFIPPPAIGSAMHGDQVLVELGRNSDAGRPEGRIVRVLTRGNPTVVGTFHRSPRQNYVTPIDEKVSKQIIIPHGLEWPQGDDANKKGASQPTEERCGKGKNEAARKKLVHRDRVLGSEAQRREWDDLEGVVVEVGDYRLAIAA